MAESVYIPFAVYTAWQGYAWSSIPEDVTREEMDILYRKIGEKRPDFMGAGDSYEGVYYNNGLLSAFRMQSVQKWDSVGRDADYCAFAFMGPDVAQDFDFGYMLGMSSFNTPTHEPQNFIEYDGPPSSLYSVKAAMKLCDTHSSSSVEFREIGDMLAKCCEYCGEWFFGRVNFRGETHVFAETGTWYGEPPQWAGERARNKASFQKINLKDMENFFKAGE